MKSKHQVRRNSTAENPTKQARRRSTSRPNPCPPPDQAATSGVARKECQLSGLARQLEQLKDEVAAFHYLLGQTLAHCGEGQPSDLINSGIVLLGCRLDESMEEAARIAWEASRSVRGQAPQEARAA
jgi:hypothetical protein